jgi:hypothetical protein
MYVELKPGQGVFLDPFHSVLGFSTGHGKLKAGVTVRDEASAVADGLRVIYRLEVAFCSSPGPGRFLKWRR